VESVRNALIACRHGAGKDNLMVVTWTGANGE
jgi:hypothetical protein